MSKIKQIIDGHVNELRALTGTLDKDKEDIFQKRKEICDSCPLKTGNSCNPNLYIHPETKEVANTRKTGFVRGCGCRLSAKQRSEGSECPAKFWGGEFKK